MSDEFKGAREFAPGHAIRWFVRAGDEMIPRQASMRGTWGYDAKCTCGWSSGVGGGVETYVASLVEEHKDDVRDGIA